MPSNIKPPSLHIQALAVYSDPHLYKYAQLIARAGFHRGTDHPKFGQDVACLALDIEARIYGNRQKVDAVNRDRKVWQAKVAVVHAMTGYRLPTTPPTAETVRKWRARWLHRTVVDCDSATPQALATLLDKATTLGIKRARKFGQFPAGIEPDFANPDPRHILVADGTYLKQYSGSRKWTDPDGDEHILNTRAKDGRPVIQDVVHALTKNHQKFTGVNFVVAVTRTPYGRVFLGVDRALGGESHTALDIFERIIERIGDGLHMICYDKGFTGWPRDWLMAEHGIPVVSLPGAKKKNSDEVKQARTDARAAIARSGVKAVGLTSTVTKAYARKRLHHDHDWQSFVERTRQGVPTGEGLPLGRSQYLSSRNRLVLVDSKHWFYDRHTHPRGDGLHCSHDLYVDDDALWEVTRQDGVNAKYRRPRCVSSRRRKDASGRWVQHTRYDLLCDATDELLQIETTWKPPHQRKKSKRKRRQQAETAMQPLARCDSGFGDIYGLRNDIESWFSWYKTRLLEGKRAASLDLNHQLLDVLYGGIITNALALRVSRLSH